MNIAKKLPKEEKEVFLKETVGKLKEVGIEFDEKGTLSAKIYEIQRIPYEGTRAFYEEKTHSMYFTPNDIKQNSIGAKRTRLHETIHASMGGIKNTIMDYKCGRGIIEGATEALVESLYGENDICVDFKERVNYNLSRECSYKRLVCIIRQMEFILGKTTHDFALNGKTDFFEEFSQIYGKDLFRYIKSKTKRLSNLKIQEREVDIIFEELQDIILEKVFDKEFEEVNSLETAHKFMERLKNFESRRACFTRYDKFEQYYNRKLHRVEEMLREMGVEYAEIEEFHKSYQYKGWMASLNESEEMLEKRKKNEFLDYLINKIGNDRFSPKGEALYDYLKSFYFAYEQKFEESVNLIFRNQENEIYCFGYYTCNDVIKRKDSDFPFKSEISQEEQDIGDKELDDKEQEILREHAKNYTILRLDDDMIEEAYEEISKKQNEREEKRNVSKEQRMEALQRKYNSLKSWVTNMGQPNKMAEREDER